MEVLLHKVCGRPASRTMTLRAAGPEDAAAFYALQNEVRAAMPHPEQFVPDTLENIARCLKEDLISMEQVKEQVMETVQVMKFNRLTKEMGLKKSSYHNVHMMLGAPGSSLVKIIEKTLYRIWGNHFLRGRYMIIPAVNDPGQFRHCNRRMQLQ